MSDQEAVIEYGSPDFTIIRNGSFVRCAVTGRKISVKDLKYWDPNVQEAYVDAAAATAAWRKRAGQ
jgi:hypothetical protein